MEKTKSALNCWGATRYFLIDDYMIIAQVQQFKELQLCIVIFVNENMGIWKMADNENNEKKERFCCKSTHYLYDRKVRVSAPKKLQKKLGLNKKIYTYLPMWTSFNSLKSHLIKNNKEIRLIEDYDNL